MTIYELKSNKNKKEKMLKQINQKKEAIKNFESNNSYRKMKNYLELNKKVTFYNKEQLYLIDYKVFGKVSFYEKYIIKNNYIVGDGKKDKNKLYLSVNDRTLLNNVKIVGEKLFDLFHDIYNEAIVNEQKNYKFHTFLKNNNEKIKMIEIKKICNKKYIILKLKKDIPYTLINLKSFPNSNIVEIGKDNIYKCILPFLKIYGFPIDYNDPDGKENSIDIDNISKYFINLYMLSYIDSHLKKRDENWKLCCKMLNIDTTLDNTTIMKQYLDSENIIQQNLGITLGKFKFECENNIPICYTNNLFEIAYERLFFDFFEKYGGYKNKRNKVPKDKKKLNIYHDKKSKKSYDKKRGEYIDLKKKYNYIKRNDKFNEYTDLLDEFCKTTQTKYTRKRDEKLKEEINNAYKNLKKIK